MLFRSRLSTSDLDELAGLLGPMDESLAVVKALAEIHYRKGDHRREGELYRKMLDINQDQPWILNNLAWLLAARGSSLSEAESHVRRALTLAGPEPLLLDTLVLVLTKKNRPQDALEIGEDATRITELAVTRFHMAIAAQSLNQVGVARSNFRLAGEMGLSKESIHPLERSSYLALQAWLADGRRR